MALVWGGDGTEVRCRVCGRVGPGHIIATATATVVGDLEVRQCGHCG